ncbi:MAG: T9SS type A sorting domain-containing protein [Rhodothermales bacterium]
MYDRLYRVSVSDLAAYAQTGVATEDLAGWPTGLGAPTLAAPGNGLDDDNDGIIDEPGEYIRFDIDVPLAQRAERIIDLAAGERPALLGDQVVWWVMNDRGIVDRQPPGESIGVEIHAMAYAAREGTAVDDMTFYTYTVYYHGDAPLEEAYLGIFVDPELGDFSDDYVGSDTTLGLAYVYNADNDDDPGSNAGYRGYGTPVPALGYDFFRGPAVPSPGDSAWIGGERVPDFRNLSMTVFGYFPDGSCATCGPGLAVEYHRALQGRWRDGTPITYGGDGRNPETGASNRPTSFMFSGDPVTHTGWTESNPDPFTNSAPPNATYDRRFTMGTGPFTLQPGDRFETTFGILLATGTDHLDSVRRLRDIDAAVQVAFDAGLAVPSLAKGSAPRRPVVLEAPGDGVLEQPLDLSLYWHANPELTETHYAIDVATDAGFTNIIQSVTQTATHLAVDELLPSTPYFWRVRAVNGGGEGPWSPTWTFTTSAAPNTSFFGGFMTTSNAAGAIDPPDMAAFSHFLFEDFPILEGRLTPEGTYPNALQPTPGVQQSLNSAVWGFHAGGAWEYGSFKNDQSFVSRVLRNDNIARFSPFDYEMRFTEACAASIDGVTDDTDCLAWRTFGGEWMEVPFELWRIGEHTPDDPNDDMRLIPAVCESACDAGDQDFVFDIGGDHLLSSGMDDPATDWVYWYLPDPAFQQPGQEGYNRFFFDGSGHGGEILARIVLVNRNGGVAPPYTSALPEPGTTFRILSGRIEPPVHSAPANNDTALLAPVTLYWYGLDYPYTLQVADNPAFDRPFVDTTLTDTTFPLEDVMAGNAYFWRLRLVDAHGLGLPISGWSATWQFTVATSAVAVEPAGNLPTSLTLEPNYPNPFNPTTHLRYALPEDAPVQLTVYDALGRRVQTLVNERQPAGWHEVTFDAVDLASGLYFYVLQAGAVTRSRSMILLR